MTYKLEFLPSALKEWNKLGRTLREQFKKKLVGACSSRECLAMRCMACLTVTKSN